MSTGRKFDERLFSASEEFRLVVIDFLTEKAFSQTVAEEVAEGMAMARASSSKGSRELMYCPRGLPWFLRREAIRKARKLAWRCRPLPPAWDEDRRDSHGENTSETDDVYPMEADCRLEIVKNVFKTSEYNEIIKKLKVGRPRRREIADALGVHPETVSRRFRKIREQCGEDAKNFKSL
ncbi:hypothetical protein ACYOEI_17150 [Singulisphaera rosea]